MTSNSEPLEETIFSRRFARTAALILIGLLVILVMLDIVFTIAYPQSPLFFRFEFDVDNEGNLATWFNGTLDLTVCMGAWLLAWLIHRQPRDKLSRLDVVGWALVGSVFMYLSADDEGQIHEHAVSALGRLADIVAAQATLPNWVRWYIWIPILGLIGIGVVWLMIVFFRRNVWHVPLSRNLIFVGLLLMLSNPVTEVLESIITAPAGGSVAPRFADELFASDRTAWLQLKLLTLIQETTEMGAMIALLTGFLVFGEWLLKARASSPQPDAPDHSGPNPNAKTPERCT